MNVYIFEYVEQVSDRYHSDGGLVIIAESMEKAMQMVAEHGDIVLTYDDWNNAKVYPLAFKEEPKIFVFPDAGCC